MLFSKSAFTEALKSAAKRRRDIILVGLDEMFFARAVLRERRLPFDIALEADPFFSESNLAHLRKVKADVKAGRNISVHDILFFH